jgi:hypothetical protein
MGGRGTKKEGVEEGGGFFEEHLFPAPPIFPLPHVSDLRGMPLEFSYAGIVARVIDAGDTVCRSEDTQLARDVKLQVIHLVTVTPAFTEGGSAEGGAQGEKVEASSGGWLKKGWRNSSPLCL